MKETERDRNRGELRSPVDGVVLERAISDERQVAAGTVLLKIGRLEDLEVEADILSQDVVNVKDGDRGRNYRTGHRSNAGARHGEADLSGRIHQGQLVGRRAATGKSNHRLQPGRLGALAETSAIWESTTACACGSSPPKRKTPWSAPRSALFRGGDGKWQVFAVRDNHARLQAGRNRTDERRDGGNQNGLEPGELVVLAPETSLKDGAAVRPIKREIVSTHAVDSD